jgi:hypothetical protein
MYRTIAAEELRKDKTLGYVYFMDRAHPLANRQGKVYLHRHVASVSRKRWLTTGEHVHHRDEDKSNNLPRNLEVTNNSAHARHHNPPIPERRCAGCGGAFKPAKSNQLVCGKRCADMKQRRVDRPSREELTTLLKTKSFCAIGRMFGVSDNAVRKWLKV